MLFLSLAFIISVTKPTVRQCEQREIYGTKVSEGFLTSPNYPLVYPPYQDCLFNLTASSNLVIHLTFTHFNLEGPCPRSSQCLNDYLVITVIDRQGREHVGDRFCGDQLPQPLHTMQNSVYIRFHSSHTNQYTGFRLRYQFLPEESILEPTSSYFDDDLKYLKLCGGHSKKKAFDGEIKSPGYPALYPRNITCNWLLRVNPGKKIYIRLRYLELSPTMAECEKASLYIIDGYRYESSALLGKDDGSQIKFCGSQLYYTEEGMKSYISTGNRLIIKFVTKDYPSPSLLTKYKEDGKPIGFRMIWTEVEELFSDERICLGFICKGGHLCVDNGQNICANRSQLCIDKSLTCNGIQNCADSDQSDEQNCYSQHIIMLACSVMLLLVALIITVILWQWIKTRRLVERRKRERMKGASIVDNDDKSTIIWEPTKCSTNLHSLGIHHHYHNYCRQQKQQNHLVRTELYTLRSAIL